MVAVEIRGLAVLLVVWLAAIPSSAREPTKAENLREANQLVQEALHREVYGQLEDRDRLLREALALEPDHALARWHLGEVGRPGRWTGAEQFRETPIQTLKRKQYERERADASPQAAGQLALANWCAKRRLPLQEYAHLNRVIRLAPDHLEARARLGYERSPDGWIKRETIWESLGDSRRVALALKEWVPRMEKIRDELRHTRQLAHQKAREELLSIDDITAIPAIEAVLVCDSPATALAAVEALSGMSQHEASLALARIAVLGPWPAVRDEATRQLRQRPWEGYVPALLAELESPIDSRFLTWVSNGQLFYRHAFVRELEGEKQVAIADLHYERRVYVPPGDAITRVPLTANPDFSRGVEARDGLALQHRRDALEDSKTFDAVVERTFVMLGVASAIEQREALRRLQNAWVQQSNARVQRVLAGATGQADLQTPQAWHNWWYSVNEVQTPSQKPVRLQHRSNDLICYHGLPTYQVTSGPTSCFVAATPVLTIAGTVPIEEVQVGDLVLAQDANTGQLAYQPVLETTRRPAAPIVRLATVGDDVLEATGGHAFWVSGDGWVRARQLKSGAVLHTLRGGVCVSDVETRPPQPTYNLVVANFHSYFVGESRILCHDNTQFAATNAVIPGLMRE